MVASIIDPVTGIVIPTPGEETGEQYAVDVSNALATLAHLTHTGEANLDGYQIPSAGININEDLSIQSNNLTNLRSTRYEDQPSELTGLGDLDSVYFVNGDLWINNGVGAPVQITSGGSIISVPTNNNYVVKSISINHTINDTDTDTLFNCDCTANAIIITLPIASTVQNGRIYIVKDEFGTSGIYTITINPSGGDTIDGQATYVIKDNFAAVAFIKLTSTRWGVFAYDKKTYQGESVSYNDSSLITLDATSDIVAGHDVSVGNRLTTSLLTVNSTAGFSGDVTCNNVYSVGTIECGAITGIGASELSITPSVTAPLYKLTSDVTVEKGRSLANGYALAADWVYETGFSAGVPVSYWKSLNIAGGSLDFLFTIPNGVRINSVTVVISPSGGHAFLPQFLPKLYFFNTSGATFGSQVDQSINVAAYQIPHNITISGLSFVVDTIGAGGPYGLRLVSEHGTDASINALCSYYTINYTRLAGSIIGED